MTNTVALTPVMAQQGAVVEIEDVVKRYRRVSMLKGGRGGVLAVDHVSLSIGRGHSVGLVGESGSGKTTLARLVVQLESLDSGDIRFGEQSLPQLSTAELRTVRRRIQLIPQDPGSSVDPRFSIGRAIAEPLAAHKLCKRTEMSERVERLLKQVSLDANAAQRKIHQFSGGQRQRIAIARALAPEPEVLVADEPTSALDVLVQAQILNLLLDLQQSLGLTLLLITHNLGAVRHVCEAIAVMYAGQIVEIATTDVLFDQPSHPYSRMLIDAVPKVVPGAALPKIRGEVNQQTIPSVGCRFSPRCPGAQPICAELAPSLEEIGPRHWVSCHFPLRYPAQAAHNSAKNS